MAVFHYVHLRAFAHETEDPARVLTALRQAAQDETARFEETRADGTYGNRIGILDGELKSAPAHKRLFAALARDDPEGFAHIAATLRDRIDENLNLHLRLDKQEAYLGRVALARDDDAITVRAKIRAFGADRSETGLETALPALEAFFLGVQPRESSAGQ